MTDTKNASPMAEAYLARFPLHKLTALAAGTDPVSRLAAAQAIDLGTARLLARVEADCVMEAEMARTCGVA